MISLENKNRLIGDFFEANSFIVNEESTNIKSPKFIVKYRAKKQRKKLISIINKLCKSDYILTRDNIYELFVYLFNNSDVYSNKNIKIYKPKDEETEDRIEGVVVLDNIMCLIHLEHNTDYMEIVIKSTTSNDASKIEINRKELVDTTGIAGDQLNKVNKYLLTIINDFLMTNIAKYTMEE